MILRPTVVLYPVRFERSAALIGTYNSSNREFTLPEPAVHTPPGPQVKLYHGGRRLNTYEYNVLESVPGSGEYDKVKLTSWAPSSNNQIIADYIADVV